MLSGQDVDGDGEIRWQDGEAGFLQLQEHLNPLAAEMGIRPAREAEDLSVLPTVGSPGARP